MTKNKRMKGNITLENGAMPLWHELFIANALSAAGYDVRFIKAHNTDTTADAYINNTIYEFKAPMGSNVRSISRNVDKASHQSPNVVFCTVRMKRIRDKNAELFFEEVCEQ